MKKIYLIEKNRLCFFFFFILFELTISIVGYSQIDQLSNWTWVGGSNINTNSYGVYGTQGVPDPANKPGDRWSSVSWVDNNGNLWLFGGVGFSSSGSAIFLDDLWKFNTNTNQWTWVKGGQTTYQPAVYGIKGEANNANTPGGRRFAVGSKGADGNLWLFGGWSISSSGCCFEYNNDLWKYDINSNQWTWMSGDNIGNQNGVYRIKGVSDPANKPGGRVASNAITDQAGNFWLLGGAGFAASAEGGLNDLWKYNIATNEWTWMSGDNGINQFGSYGTQGTPASTNKPGSRYSSLSWLGPDGNIWIYGGNGYGSGQQGDLSDLWKYNIATNQWTWVKGTAGANQVSVYGTKGIAATDNRPGGREQAVGWTDSYGNLWLMGGNGLASEFGNYLNDLWKYNISSNQWTWIKGDQTRSQLGIYGTMGAPDPANKPGGRRNATSWIDNNGNFWLFGGDGYASNGFDDLLNDLWKLSPSNTILSCPANVTVTPPSGQCYAVVNNIDPILTPSGYSPTIVYSLTGATIATGAGTLSGRTFNVGITTVTYSLPDNPSKNCSFTVTVTDNQNPTITCPSNISVNTTEGVCGMEVTFPAVVASDNCAIDLATNFSGDRQAAGNMFNIVALNTITITSFDARITSAFQPGNNISIYYKVGTHVGFENNAGAWTLIGSASNVLSNGDNVSTPVPVPINITIPAGQTYAFYITITNGNFLRYSINLGTVNVSDGNIQIMTGTGGVYPFGSFSRNRGWNGIVHYNLDATVIQTAGLPSGSEFPVGTTTNTFVATDASGNTATCSFAVTVNYPVTPAMIISTTDVANNFCNGILLTANSNVPVQSYSWSNGVTTESNFLTTANASGTYTVNAVSASGCPAIPSAEFVYDKQAWTNSYTLLATYSIKLQSNNTVKKGSVGVVNAGGTISMKKNVNIEGAGAFLKADNISTYLPSSILQISDPATDVLLPDIPPHTSPTSIDPNATVPNNTTIEYGNLRNVTIGINCNVTLKGNIYGNITIGSGSKVLFTQPYINVTAITMNAGTVSTNTQLKFSGDAIVRCAGSILVNTRCMINPDNHKVIFYLGKTSGAPVSFTVAAGGNETVNASMYIPTGKISVGGHATNMTYMNGKFIAENIETLDKNVIWNWYDCTPAVPAQLITSKTSNATKEQLGKPIIGFNVKAWPNPSEHQFTLNVESNSKELVMLKVYDMYGRVVHSVKGTANRQYQFGNNFLCGAYVAEVRQGVNRSAVKLIKQ